MVMQNKSPPPHLTQSQHRAIIKGEASPREVVKDNANFQNQMKTDAHVFKKGHL